MREIFLFDWFNIQANLSANSILATKIIVPYSAQLLGKYMRLFFKETLSITSL